MKNKARIAIYFSVTSLFLIIASVLLSGCVHLNQLSVVRMPGNDNAPLKTTLGRFDGLQTELTAAATNNQTLRLLIVHGMGISAPGYSSNLIDRIAANLNLKLIGGTSETNYQSPNYSVISIRSFGNGSSNLCTYELTWSPMTTPIKTNQFALDFQKAQIESRQCLNNELKTNLVDDSLSDVVLYLGKYRSTLQQPIIAAIQKMEQDSTTQDDPVAIITHSLGSYMVIDTLKSMAGPERSSNEVNTAENYASRVKQIFMMANQIPLLDLSDRTNFDSAQSGLFASFFQLHERGKSNRKRELRPELQIVAFSDPNDLLSFKLRRQDVYAESVPGIRVNGFDVIYTVEHWSIAGVVSDPAKAHTGWWTDSKVPQFLAFGHDETKAYGQ